MIIRFFANLRDITRDTETTIKLKNAQIKIKDVLEVLITHYGESFRDAAFDAEGELYVKILINGRNIDYLDGLESKVLDDDIVYMFPPIAGGNYARL